MSGGSLLLAGGTPGRRAVLPNSRILIHQPSGGFPGQSSDVAIHARVPHDPGRHRSQSAQRAGRGARRGPVDRSLRRRRRYARPMKLGLLTAAFPDRSLREVADWAQANGFDDARGRVLAGDRVASSGATRASPTSTCESLDAAGAAAVRATVAERGLEISVARVLPEQPAPRRVAPRPRSTPTCARRRRGRAARRAHRRHVRRQRPGALASTRTCAGSPRSGRPLLDHATAARASRSRSRTAR